MPDPRKADIWYYTDGFEYYGPTSAVTLIHMHLGGEIDDDTFIWKNDWATDSSRNDWQRFAATELKAEVDSLPPVPGRADKTLDAPPFGNDNNPLIAIGMYGLLFFLLSESIILALVLGDSGRTAELLTPERMLFIFYLACYVGLWITYFRSKSTHSFEQYATLRRLLLNYSVQWQTQSSTPQDRRSQSLIMTERETMYQKKAATGLSALAMLASAALLELVMANSIFSSMPEPINHSHELIWIQGALVIASLCAFSAFISFLIAADALESLFNRFKFNLVARQLMQHFYQVSVNPRYFGFAFLIAAAAVLIAARSALLGAVALALVFIIGYPHWFPHPSVANLSTQTETSGSQRQHNVWLRMLVALSLPAAVFLFGL